MDEMDRLLGQLPSEAYPPDLPRRISQAVRQQQRRRMWMRLGISSLLAISGLWLLLPALLEWLSIQAPPVSGLPWLLEWVNLALQGMGAVLTDLFTGLSLSQSTLAALGASALPGILALAISALLVLDYLLPKAESR